MSPSTGNKMAINGQDEIRKLMTPEAIGRGQALAKEISARIEGKGSN